MDDPYEALGVHRGASRAEIKKAYRRAARAHHPDLNPGDEGATKRFQKIQDAYETLSDPVARQRYDREGTTSRRGRPRRRTRGRPPPPAVPPAYSRSLVEAADRMRALLLRELLPRYIAAWYRGQGAMLVNRLLADVEGYRLLEMLRAPEPPRWARRMAEHTDLRLRVDVRPVLAIDRGKPALGRALQSLEVVRGRLSAVWRVQVFAGSFHARGYRVEDQLDRELLQLLATELVRVLEANLPQPLRPLENRELLLPRPTLAQSRQADTQLLLRRAAVIGFVVAVIGALSLMILPGFM